MGQVEHRMDSLVRLVLVASLILALAGSVVFCYRYIRYSPWYVTPVGQNMLALMVLLAVLEGLPLIALLAHGQSWVLAAYLVTYPLLPIITWWRTILLVQTQRETQRNSKSEGIHR